MGHFLMINQDLELSFSVCIYVKKQEHFLNGESLSLGQLNPPHRQEKRFLNRFFGARNVGCCLGLKVRWPEFVGKSAVIEKGTKTK